jgi:hypothetical protein
LCGINGIAGFERNIYGDREKCEIKVLTPNQVKRTSIKEGSQPTHYLLIRLQYKRVEDNQNRPLTQLFFTTIWRGYFGWTIIRKTRLGF